MLLNIQYLFLNAGPLCTALNGPANIILVNTSTLWFFVCVLGSEQARWESSLKVQIGRGILTLLKGAGTL